TDATAQRRVLLTTKTPLTSAGQTVTGVLTTSVDITERKRAEEHLHYLAHHDVLTGLPNRHALTRQLEEAIDRARDDTAFALHFLDLDRFKSISHAFGYESSELLLQAVATRMKSLLGPDALLSRLGGDEFAILQTGLRLNAAEADSAALGETIRASFTEAFDVNAQVVHANVSIGTALFPSDGKAPSTLMQHADLAMYQAKARGRNRVCRFEPALQAAVRKRAQLEIDLRAGLMHNELVLHFQPQLDVRSLRIVGVEALLRWKPDSHPLIFPDQFLPMAEEAGLMTEINTWVLDAACQQAADWERKGMPIRVGINLSASLFHQYDVAALVQAAIGRAGASPHLIDLELTETTLLEDHASARRQIVALQDEGVSFCVDDFGTGYASFDYLERLSVNGIKIDQGFVHNLSTRSEGISIIRAIIGLGHALGIRVIAEGVETPAQLSALQDEGCDEVQGYLFSRALSAAAFEQFYADHTAKAAIPQD
ncbi:MAG TPA: EAL domain-containing protein, partial [Acidisoma sp.]|nr:EAL domain-containing protein [Acidisoma sp.]